TEMRARRKDAVRKQSVSTGVPWVGLLVQPTAPLFLGPANDQVQQRGRLERSHATKSRSASPVCCNGWFFNVIPLESNPGPFVYPLFSELAGEQLAQGVEAGAARAAQRRRVIVHEAPFQKSRRKPTPLWRGGL